MKHMKRALSLSRLSSCPLQNAQKVLENTTSKSILLESHPRTAISVFIRDTLIKIHNGMIFRTVFTTNEVGFKREI